MSSGRVSIRCLLHVGEEILTRTQITFQAARQKWGHLRKEQHWRWKDPIGKGWEKENKPVSEGEIRDRERGMNFAKCFKKRRSNTIKDQNKTGPKVDLGLCPYGALSGLTEAVFMHWALQSPCWGDSRKVWCQLGEKVWTKLSRKYHVS